MSLTRSKRRASWPCVLRTTDTHKRSWRIWDASEKKNSCHYPFYAVCFSYVPPFSQRPGDVMQTLSGIPRQNRIEEKRVRIQCWPPQTNHTVVIFLPFLQNKLLTSLSLRRILILYSDADIRCFSMMIRSLLFLLSLFFQWQQCHIYRN
jgi:hypothetical protein